MTTRKYTSRSQQTTLTGSVTSGATIIPVVSATTVLGGATVSAGQTMTVVIDPDTALEEVVDITAVSGNNLTITRAIDGSSAQDHSAGAVVRHMIIGRDLREANTHIEASNGVHGLASTSSVVGTQDAQTLYNKTLVAPTLTSTLENDTGITFEGVTADAYETFLTVVDPTQDNTITLPNTSGTIGIIDAVQTLTNKTITSPTINGSPVITGLSSAGMVNSSAAPKIYVDSILGSATAASTSAASAATSASSAATSASSAATSASSALTSQTAAATSAASAATSASSASTYLTSVQTSAASAATSATSAAASATTAAASVATITTSAASAATSAASAATSAASAAAYTSAAATSAASAATSASSAAASAASMTASVAAAATSATSAAASATAAATSATSAAASATTASNSATTATTQASNASASATAAATSATSAATQATAAATSATSAATQATAAATSATSAAASATAAATSATSSASSFTSIDQKYLGAKASAPTLNNQGGALATGAQYWNSSNNTMYIWNGTAWAAATATANITMYRYTASGGETSKSGADDNSATLAYAVGFEQVYVNGVLLVRGVDYTASTGSSITGLTPLVANDILVVLAFTAFSVANAVPLSTYTAKGDVAVGTGASTVGTLSAGADGTTLVANSSASTGVSWAGPSVAAGKNAIINGAMEIAQRGITFTNPGNPAYTLDRWKAVSGANLYTITQSSSAPSGFIYSCSVAATGSNSYMGLGQQIEYTQFYPLIGNAYVISFWAKSLTSNAASTALNVRQNISTSQDASNPSTDIQDNNFTLTTSWQKFSFTSSSTLLSAASAKSLYIQFLLNQTVASGDGFAITGIQLELGSVPTAFSRAGGTLQGELAACQRYFETSYDTGATIGGTSTTGFVGSPVMATNTGSNIYRALYIPYKVTKRATPTITTYDGLGASGKITTYSSADLSQTHGVTGTADNIGMQNYRVYWLTTNGGAGWHHTISAEL